MKTALLAAGRAVRLAAGLALGLAAPLAAQEADPAPIAPTHAPSQPDAAPDAPAPDPAPTPDPAPALAPDAITIITASESFLARHDLSQPLDPLQPLCIEPGETVTLASEQVVFAMPEAMCAIPAVAEQEALGIEGGLALIEMRGRRMARGPMIDPARPRPIIFRVAGGSETVLGQYPRGRVIQRDARFCLKAGEQLTIAASNGQQVSYTGPGCMQRNTRPTLTNIGGFTFGWAVPTGRASVGAAR